MVNGLPEDYEIAFNDEVWPNNQKEFLSGTVLADITPSATGYSFIPAFQNVTMDMDRTLVFEAVAVDENYMTGFTQLILNNGQVDAGKPLIDEGDGIWSTASDISYFITSYFTDTGSEFGCKLVAGDRFRLGFGYDDLYETNALMWDGSELTLNLNGTSTVLTPQPVLGEFIRIVATGTSGDGFGADAFIGEGITKPITNPELNNLYTYQVYVAGAVEGSGNTMSYPQGKNLTIVPI